MIACSGNKPIRQADSISIVKNIITDTVQKTIKKSTDTVFKPYVLVDDYFVTDSGEYTNGPMGGKYIIIKNKAFVDTIDQAFGITKMDKNFYLYQKLTHANSDDDNDKNTADDHSLWLNYGDYHLVKDGKIRGLSKLAPGFDSYFSSPNVINKKIYYWQLKKQASTELYNILAREFDPLTGKSESKFLFVDGVETDDAGYFANPYLKNDTIYFAVTDKQQYKFSPSFKPYN